MRDSAATFLAILLATACVGAAPATAPPTGKSKVEWPLLPDKEFERSYDELIARHQFKIIKGYPQKKRDEVWPGGASPTYQVYVPADYDGSKPFGLFVWISSGPRGA